MRRVTAAFAGGLCAGDGVGFVHPGFVAGVTRDPIQGAGTTLPGVGAVSIKASAPLAGAGRGRLATVGALDLHHFMTGELVTDVGFAGGIRCGVAEIGRIPAVQFSLRRKRDEAEPQDQTSLKR